MRPLRSIPHQYQEGFLSLFRMTDKEFDVILNTLSTQPLKSSIRGLTESISQGDEGKFDVIRSILVSTGSLLSLTEKETNITDISSSIYSALVNEMEKSKNPMFKELIAELSKERFTSRLEKLLTSDHLYYAAKSNDLMHEYQNVFINSRVATDIRPIYKIDTEVTPIAGLVIHNLHIHFRSHQEGDHQDFFIAMDSQDIKTLKEVLIRAEKKENSLKHIFNNSGMINLNE